MLDLKHDEDLVVGVAEVLLGPGIKRHREAAAADAARPIRVVASGGDGLLGFFPGVDHRHDHAPGAGIEHPLEVLPTVPRDTHHRRGAAGGHRREHLGQRPDIYWIMLGVDDEPVEPDAADVLRGLGRGEGEPGSARRLPCRGSPPAMVCSHRHSPSSLVCWWICTLPVMLGTADHCSSSSDSILPGSISTPNPGRSETEIMPSTGLTGSCQKNWSSSFHFTRYSTIGASSSGDAMVRWVLAGTESPWAITGMS